MTGRELRAQVLLEEARVLGLDLADLIAADTSGSAAFPTVRSYLEAIADVHPGDGRYLQAGREAWDVLAALGTWGDRWTDVLPDHADPNAVLWSWCHNYQNVENLPVKRTVVQFDFRDDKRRWISEWFHIEDQTIELCRFDPGFGIDLHVRIEDPLPFAEWHLGLIAWADVLRRSVTMTGPRQLQRALPTWNSCPDGHRQRRAAAHDTKTAAG